MRRTFSPLYRFTKSFALACISFFGKFILNPIFNVVGLAGLCIKFLFCCTFYIFRIAIGLLLKLPGTEKLIEDITFNAPSIETNPEQYASILSEWTFLFLNQSSNLISHFPDPLPPAATHIKLSFYPGFLQGGAWFQVRLTLPVTEVADVFELATQTSIYFYDGGDIFTAVNSQNDGLPGTSFYTADENQADNFTIHNYFPTDYRIFVFDSQFNKHSSTSGWSRGIVVSKQRNEVIYYAEIIK